VSEEQPMLSAEIERLRAVTFEHHWRLQTLEAQMRKRVLVSEARTAMLEASRAPAPPGCVSRSQYGEDEVLWSLLGRPLDGVFVEAGAIDGLKLSVSAVLESMGWTGLLVEPVPEQAAACRTNRPASTVIQAALGAPGHPPATTFVSVEGAPEFSGIEPDAEHLGLAAEQGGLERSISVPMTTLDAALEAVGAETWDRIDAVVLDLEGGEDAALLGFDLERWEPRVLMIEDHDRSENSPIASAMKDSGYKLAGIVRINRVYVHPDDHDALERARSMIWM
jgi:FkbM family methyltransferase